MRTSPYNQKGFTIVELIVVVAVVAVLAALIIVGYNEVRQRADRRAIESTLSQNYKLIETERNASVTNTYPPDQASIPELDSNDGVTLSYTSLNSSTGFCLEGSKGSHELFVTSRASKPVAGRCDGLTMWAPINGNFEDISGRDFTVSHSIALPPYNTYVLTSGGPTYYAVTYSNYWRSLLSPVTDIINPTEGTITFWHNFNSSNPTPAPVMSAGATGTDCTVATVSSFCVNLLASKILSATWRDGAGNTDTASTDATMPNGWHHIALTWSESANTMRFYIDGVAQTSATFGGNNMTGWDDTFYLGGTSSSFAWLGWVDDIRIYSRAITQDEINDLDEYGPQ